MYHVTENCFGNDYGGDHVYEVYVIYSYQIFIDKGISIWL